MPLQGSKVKVGRMNRKPLEHRTLKRHKCRAPPQLCEWPWFRLLPYKAKRPLEKAEGVWHKLHRVGYLGGSASTLGGGVAAFGAVLLGAAESREFDAVIDALVVTVGVALGALTLALAGPGV